MIFILLQRFNLQIAGVRRGFSRSTVLETTTVQIDALEKVAALALQRHGASEFAAREVAKALRRAEQVGNSSCGLGHLEQDCKQLLSGRAAGNAVPKVHHVRPGLVQVDADNGFAQPAFTLGLPMALASAASLGIAVLAVSRAYTCAALGYFAEQVAENGFIGIAFTNASASVATPGGARPLIGTNPVAMAVPEKSGGIAFQFDQCTSAANLRQVREAALKSEQIPLGWAVSAQGEPTTDAVQALAGALLPAGGARGFGFGLMVEILASFFTDSAMSLDTRSLKETDGTPHSLGIFCLLLDPTAIAQGNFWSKLDRLKDAVASEPGTRLPGTRIERRQSVVVKTTLWEKAWFLAASNCESV
jgi:(2R)-3-sulfolactate dehydrogenase (NADP+)